jgi:hypothetical protein
MVHKEDTAGESDLAASAYALSRQYPSFISWSSILFGHKVRLSPGGAAIILLEGSRRFSASNFYT